MSGRTLTFAQAVNEATSLAMTIDPSVICFGLGVTDPRRIFGTTAGLLEKFGSERVFDMPTSENAMTGVAIGASLNGVRPVMVHQRLDFFLLAMDQLVNNAAKLCYTFDGRFRVPLTVRLITGRGWGQGPTHSQSLHAWFAHVPGLKVVMPVSPADAKGLLLSAIFDDNPVLFFEHRWLHNTIGEVPEGDRRVPLGSARRAREGTDVSLVAMSYMVIEALHAAETLAAAGISCDVIDLRTIRPLDWDTVFASVRRTGRLVALDTGSETGSVAGEIVARAASECFGDLKCAPRRICMPDLPTPTSPALTDGFYRTAEDVVRETAAMFGRTVSCEGLRKQGTWPHDVPGDWFKGPF